MPHPSTVSRNRMKEERPEEYATLLSKQRDRSRARRAEIKRKLASGELSAQEKELLEQKRLEYK